MKEAEQHSAEDQRRRELVEARNTADSLIYQTEKSLSDLGDKVPSADREQVEKQIKDLRETLNGEDIANIRRLSEDLNHAMEALGQQVYSQTQEAPGEPQAGGPSDGQNGASRSDEGEETVEGEFHEV